MRSVLEGKTFDSSVGPKRRMSRVTLIGPDDNVISSGGDASGIPLKYHLTNHLEKIQELKAGSLGGMTSEELNGVAEIQSWDEIRTVEYFNDITVRFK